MTRVRYGLLLLGFFLRCVGPSPVHAAVDLSGPFFVTQNFGPLFVKWNIEQSGTTITVSFSGGAVFASGTIDPDTGTFNLVDSNPLCDPGIPGSIVGSASDSDHFTGTWTTGTSYTPTICGLFTTPVTGFRDFCGNGAIDTGEQCDGGQCCATNCRFAENGLACDDGNPVTSSDQCVDGSCGHLTNYDLLINTYTAGTQARARVASAADGSVVVVWNSYIKNGTQNGIVGQRLNSTGMRVGTEFRIDATGTYASVATSTSGFLVVWEDRIRDGSNQGVFGQRYDSNGMPRGEAFQVNAFTTSAQSSPAIAMDAAGNALVIWTDFGQRGIFARRFDSSGAAVGSEFLVTSMTTQYKRYPAVAALGDNSFAIVWNNGDTIAGRLCDPSGPVGTDFVVAPPTVYFQARPAIAASPDAGDFLVTWQTEIDHAFEIRARRYSSDGSALGAALLVNTDTARAEESPVVSPEPDGAFLLVWTSPTDGASLGVFGQRYARDDTPIGAQFRVPSVGLGRQYDASIAAIGDGRSFVTWTDQDGRDGGGFGVFGRVLTDLPPPTTPTATATSSVSGTPTPSACIADCDGNHVVDINELITAVTIALDPSALARCDAADADGDGTLAVNELVQAVNSALHGCGR